MHRRSLQALVILILFGVSGALYLKYQRLELEAPRFQIVKTSAAFSSKKIFESQIIMQPSYLPAAHSSSFTMLPDGRLLAFWFAGTKEGQPDVKIWHSIYQNESWSLASALVDPRMIASANHRYVIKVGNPVIYRAANGLLHLFVVSVSVGGWSGSTLNHLISDDNGISWSKPERIVISPFFNISTLVRTAAVSLTDGGFYLPVYHELMRKYPELLRFNAQGVFVEQIRITSKNRMLQPSVMPINELEARAYFRNSTNQDNMHQLFSAYTNNGGKTWQTPIATNLTNHDSSLEAANLNTGKYLLVYNQGNRGLLRLAISSDGLNWRPIYDLENESGGEFSYPSLQVNGDYIDILYTYNRKNIKHVRFNRAWLSSLDK